MSLISPEFSIITICLNNKAGLIRTYESLKAQSSEDYEWIVIDGASRDGTVDFLQSLPASKRLIWKSEPDSGLYDAMNKGMALAKGEHLLFLNSGDELVNDDTLEKVHENSGEKDFIYGDALEKKDDGMGNYKSAYSYHRRWYGMFTHHQAMFYRRKAVGNKKYDLSYKIAADYAFTCSMLANTNSVKYINIPICLFEGGGLTSTTAIHIQGLKEQWRVGREILNRSVLQCLMTLFLSLGKHSFMRLFPVLYNKLRFRTYT